MKVFGLNVFLTLQYLYQGSYFLFTYNKTFTFNVEAATNAIYEHCDELFQSGQNTISNHMSDILNKYADHILSLLVPMIKGREQITKSELEEFVQASGLINHFNHQTFETAISNLDKEGYITVDYDDLISLTTKGRSRVRQFFESDFQDSNSQTLNSTFELESDVESSSDWLNAINVSFFGFFWWFK